MYYTIYETTNTINWKKYIGMHATNFLADDYLGSGIGLKKAVKKYGSENFVKTYLWIFDNEQEMIEKEKEVITQEIVNNKLYYNMVIGGDGGMLFVKGTKEYDKWYEKIKNNQPDRNGKNNPNYGKHCSEETKRKISESQKGKPRNLSHEHIQKLKLVHSKPKTEEHKKKIGLGNKGKIVSPESRLKMSLARKAYLEKKKSA